MIAHSDVKTETATIWSTPCALAGIYLVPDGTNAVTIDIYDGTSTSGRKVIPQVVQAGNGGPFSLQFPKAIFCPSGIHVVVAVAGAGTVAYTVFIEV